MRLPTCTEMYSNKEKRLKITLLKDGSTFQVLSSLHSLSSIIKDEKLLLLSGTLSYGSKN